MASIPEAGNHRVKLHCGVLVYGLTIMEYLPLGCKSCLEACAYFSANGCETIYTVSRCQTGTWFHDWSDLALPVNYN